ncbi:Gfo/Idh/MocA family oxidoreductase [Horticoccus luteus]|uniref:Gfo/Idh/MocA family oxidoreductase n=1 Tax=Horticoccus luteus TaxID=2862869 RepID=A0A8F9TUN0_9BACT|nr:Gfo/Idh/MocA family oxidoreductase [Horticoccus luteus]QYM78094.1 Gfo/Idh/MocA family oxidoreductase [Horticoccus luteus]
MLSKVKIGLIGCGNISDAYFKGAAAYDILEIVACADLDLARAQAKARQHGIAKACTPAELLADPAVEIVVNLTVPQAHAPVNEQVLRAGKHAYVEKPFALDTTSSRRVLEVAAAQGRRVGCAPDTFLGGGIQTCRQLLDEGAIGDPVAAVAFMMCPGHESWHPAPEFYYQQGGGPMFDMGPYYITALVNLLGPAKRVSGSAKITFPERTITEAKRAGQKIAVQTPTHITGAIDFANGATATMVMSFDVTPYPLPCLVVYGTKGTMEVPDPNTFGGPVRVRKAGEKEFVEMPLTHSVERARGTGVADMAYAIRAGRPHRASGELAHHVVEVMAAFEKSSNANQHVMITSTCERPAMLPPGVAPNVLDA